jgi:PleD family two-component response regulator
MRRCKKRILASNAPIYGGITATPNEAPYLTRSKISFIINIEKTRDVSMITKFCGTFQNHEKRISMAKILVIDDDKSTTQLLKIILSKDKHEVTTVNNSEDSLSTALLHNPDLILLDLMMPRVNGLEICKNLRAKSQFTQVPIIFFTSSGNIKEKVAAFDSGATDFITKPVHPGELKIRIKALLSRSEYINESK